MARPAPNFNSIVHSPPFTFLVGPDHIKLTIQSGLARHVSQPLDELMNNGHTRESRHHIAVLEEEDVETFVGFCEFAYTGDYTVPNRRKGMESTPAHGAPFGGPAMMNPIPPPAPSPPRTPALGEEMGVSPEGGDDAGAQNDGAEGMPDSGKKGKKGKNKKKRGGKSFDEGAASALTPPSTPPPMAEGEEQKDETKEEENEGENQGGQEATQGEGPFDQDPSQQADASRPKPLRPEPQNPFLFARRSSVTLWDEFTSLQYGEQQYHSAMGLPSPILRSVSSYSNETGQEPYVLFHAKLYVFASRYLIPTLAQLCLTKLHRDLICYPLTTSSADNAGPTNVPKILELLHFAYTSTKREDPAFAPANAPPARDNQLRNLVTHFAACKVRELAGYQPPDYSPASYTSPEMGLDGKDTSAFGLMIPPNLGFRDLLDGIGEMASDLVYRMM
ncbi:uncharacterized protein CIMG_02194 [Coccidioides immitis RS]|uniref:BTB domain-containing protein n=3 Tax=Coccidioides immitis TaxID=5501 RepID=J3KKU8_COCIM|nr:uncharacterized protein CIMG_02194 [Coccidioides immitis RS]EAS36840.3 hypothetical protein CIMG_02194 [Coccidioides immitis RS]KMP09745.1 hypothetical protein CIRG_08978 [Coccidioides immitis RMSCC 2394]KMU75108.1 hypothetical protein CISG_04395 [Coccidioides immitis RMSCC 3703]TPX25101.1 hypothetical protein DIZ76_010550 [Coccidioides immitis]